MGNKTRNTSNLVSDNNIFVDISNDRVGIGSTQPTTKLDVVGTVKATSFSGITTSMISDYGNGLAGGYSNSNVDTHLNTGTASSGQILSWNGSDYAWVADQTGGGGGGDAATLDGIDSTQFLRSDAADTKTSGHLDFVDGVYARFGTGQDLQIYHNGNHSHVNDTGTGNLYIGGNQIWINDANNTNVSAVFNPTSYSALYYNSSKKFETTGAGVTVTGTAFSNQLNVSGVSTFSSDVSVNAKLKLPDGSSSANYAGFGNNDDLKIFHNGTHSIVRETGTGSLYLQSDDNVILGKDSNTEIMVKGVADGAVELYYDNVKKLETTGYGVTITGGINVSGVSTFQDDINLPNNESIYFGNTNRSITSSGDELILRTAGANDIKISANDSGATHGNVELTATAGGKVYLTGTGGVGIYHTNTTLKLETTNTGVVVTGILTATTFSGITTSMISDYGNGLAGGYSNTNVDTHLNTSTASSGEVLSWTGTDYDWVAQSGGGSGFSPDSQENLYSGTGAGAASDADTCFNIGIGYSAGASLNSGDNNIFLGCYAGNSTDSGYSNVFLGTKAGANHTSGNYNVAIGQCANASGTTTGQHNVFVGCGAGDCVTSGCDNVYLGRGAGNDVTTARCNIALGFYAGSSNLAGIHNIFLGNNAGGNSSSGNCNINIGQRTGFCNAGGNLNNFIGHYAGFSNTTGCFNNYFGYAAGYCNCTGSGNNFFGQNSGFDFSSGSNNVFIGYYSGKLQTSGDCNIAIGHNACLPNKTGSSQLAIGAGSTNWIAGDSSYNVTIAGIATVTATGIVEATKFCGDGSCLTGLPTAGFSADAQDNLFAGFVAGNAADSDTCRNIAIGCKAACALNAGDDNVILGTSSALCLTTGSCNVFMGFDSGKFTVCGSGNVYLGQNAGYNSPGGDNNVFLGVGAGQQVSTGEDNIFLGRNSGGQNASAPTTGSDNISLGRSSGNCLTSGSSNIFLGQYAGLQSTNCSYNVFVGSYAGKRSGGGYNIFFGRFAGQGSGTVSNNTGGCNVIIGTNSGCIITSGTRNVFLGEDTGRNLSTGSSNVFLGASAGKCVTTGGYNVFLGPYSGCGTGNKTGNHNIGLGRFTGKYLTSGACNIFFGYNAGDTTTSGCCNIAIGREVELPSATGNGQLAIGDGTNRWITGDSSFNVTVNCITATKFCGDGSCLTNLPSSGGGSFSPDSQENLYAGTSTGTSSSNACFNIGIGYSAANALSIGDCNVFLGAYAGTNVDTGDSVFIGRNAGKGQSGSSNIANVFIGSSTGCCITTGSFNVFLGCGAGKKVTTGQYNISLGLGAGQSNCTGRYNVNIGANAGSSNTSCYNVFLGAYAGGGITGSHNIFIGCCSGCNPSTGDRNIVIGNNAACSIGNNADYNVFLGEYAGHTTTSGSNNVAIGHSVALPSATGSCQFAIGNGTNRWIYGDSNFNIYDKDGNQLNGSGGGGGGLSYFTESENTSSPNNTVAANRFLATGSGTNIDAVFQPKGTGAFLAQLPDSATTGGNKRGCYAVDLQMIRGCATCVASGPFASIAGGCGNKAGDCGFVGGGVLNSASWWGSVTGGCSNTANSNWAHVGGGHANSAGYAGVVAGGQSNQASTYASVLGGMGNRATGYMAAVVGTRGSCANGDCSVAIGYQACNHGRHGSIAIGAGAGIFGSNLAKIQYSIMNIGRDTTDAT